MGRVCVMYINLVMYMCVCLSFLCMCVFCLSVRPSRPPHLDLPNIRTPTNKVEKKSDTDRRRRVEEAMTAARVRKTKIRCMHGSVYHAISITHPHNYTHHKTPQVRRCANLKCQQTYLKDAGCNKARSSRTRTCVYVHIYI